MPKVWPAPEELLRRLRAVYCRHRGICYERYDRMVASEEITWAELLEVTEVLFCELQNAGLYDFIFREEAARRDGIRARLGELERAKQRVASLNRLGVIGDSQMAELARESAALRAELSD